jgi:hypothetical protein
MRVLDRQTGQIGHDERVHKEESIATMDEPRFE